MKINVRRQRSMKFKDLMRGDVFEAGDFYMKTCGSAKHDEQTANSVRLRDGLLLHFADHTEVERYSQAELMTGEPC